MQGLYSQAVVKYSLFFVEFCVIMSKIGDNIGVDRMRQKTKIILVMVVLLGLIGVFVLGVGIKYYLDMKEASEKEAVWQEDDGQVLEEIEEEEDEFVVCIDAGHGFDDIGCSSALMNGVESEVNLAMAKRLQTELEALGVTTILTHDGESYPSEQTIRDKAAEYGIAYDETRIIDNHVFSAYERTIYTVIMHHETPIDFFVSLHVNSCPEHPELSQYELYYYEEAVDVPLLEKFSESLAEKLDNAALISALDSEEAYTVTRWATYPAILIEIGYSTNEEDARKINSQAWREDFCETLAEEIYNIKLEQNP